MEDEMILAVSIGNTNIRCAFGKSGEYDKIVMPTNAISGPQDFISYLPGELGLNIKGYIISSVVPEKTGIVARAVEDHLNIRPKYVNVAKCGIDVSNYEGTLGQDRAVCAVAAAAKYPLPLIVVDFGTATTLNIINSKKIFIGGAILPGIRIGMLALSKNTALLPNVEESSFTRLIGRNTQECIVSGAIIGTVCAVEGYINRACAELEDRLTVVTTGGNAPALLAHCGFSNFYEPDLVIDGLFTLYSGGYYDNV
jgi:type III pantothenate kinase